jgi:hypothetical protein
VAGFYERDNEPSGSIRKYIFLQAEGQSAFQVISCTMEKNNYNDNFLLFSRNT